MGKQQVAKALANVSPPGSPEAGATKPKEPPPTSEALEAAAKAGQAAAKAAAAAAAAATGGQEAAEARSQVDLGELLLKLMRSELSFQAARYRLLSAHMAILPHCATPSQRTQISQRILDLAALRPLCAPDGQPLTTAAAPTAPSGTATPSQAFATAASAEAVAAGARLHSCAQWCYGDGHAAQLESLDLEASLLVELITVGHRLDAPVPNDGLPQPPAAATEAENKYAPPAPDNAAEATAPAAAAVRTRPDSAMSTRSVAFFTYAGITIGGLTGTLRSIGGALAYASGATSDCIASVLMHHVAIESSAAHLATVPGLSRGLGSVAIRLALLRHAAREVVWLREATEARAHNVETPNEYADTGLLGGWSALSNAIEDIVAAREPVKGGGHRAQRAQSASRAARATKGARTTRRATYRFAARLLLPRLSRRFTLS